MGRRSRKRLPADGVGTGAESTRAERDAARRRRAAGAPPASSAGRSRQGVVRPPLSERPPPPWGSFPLTEILVLVGIVLMVWGFAAGTAAGASKLAAGLAIAALGGLELSVREHVTGFRSHTTLLATAVGIVVIVVLGLVIGVEILGVLLIAGVLSGAIAFYLLRELFRRRSGGATFR